MIPKGLMVNFNLHKCKEQEIQFAIWPPILLSGPTVTFHRACWVYFSPAPKSFSEGKLCDGKSPFHCPGPEGSTQGTTALLCWADTQHCTLIFPYDSRNAVTGLGTLTH